MFHLFHGKLTDHHHTIYLENDHFGISVIYSGDKKKGTYYIFPQIDQNTHTIKYYAFDHADQKNYFETLLKIQGIGPKSAHQLAMLPQKDLEQAVEKMDMGYFQKIPGIGPKSAKRLLVELKSTLGKSDLAKLDIDEHLYKDIVNSLKALGYDPKKVKALLPECPIALEKKNLPQIMKWLVDNL